MQATVEQLAQIQVFAQLETSELEGLQAHSRVQDYQAGEMVMQESDRIPAKLFALLTGSLRITKIASTGKETILRTLSPGEIFAAPALLGNGIAPATVTAERNCLVITVEKDALLEAMRNNPEIALRMLMVFNQRLQQLHDTVHGLVSERAIVRLARLIQYFAEQYGTEKTPDGICLKANLSYYKIARSIGITYEECVRLIKSMKSVLVYRRGGKIAILDAEALEALALACASASMASGKINY
ncbi:Crp/Fnr family transcriptional regulator [Microseira wollei]|uniref:Cyclic nucleotide-binding domain (cNMP-BD) protein n=1 Tax=Microseira wollei NIES-4236 TaxID=2530354 RepID=A0AAV3XTG8_9CYAN|nr:Crp/Fnr family transcriptional regulator [Microseira wollei]GET43362.1 cyclic nucleotide-binding domain (cNMP-BD) protein [Microseira wollei NIES-4236]